MITTGEILSKYLKEKSITQINFALITKVTPQYVSNILNDKKSPSKNFLKECIRVLKINKNDVELINRYEIFRRYSILLDEAKEVRYIGRYTDLGYISDLSNKIIKLSNFDFSFPEYIFIETNDLKPVFNKFEYIFLEKVLEIENIYYYLDKILFLEYENISDFAKIEIIENKIVIRFLNKNNKSKILSLTSYKKMNIIGYVVGKYIDMKEVK